MTLAVIVLIILLASIAGSLAIQRYNSDGSKI